MTRTEKRDGNTLQGLHDDGGGARTVRENPQAGILVSLALS